MVETDSMGREYPPEFKTSVVEEALKGERDVNVIGAEFQLGPGVLRRWLLEHYNQTPDDKRRHLVVRGGGDSSRAQVSEGKDDEGAHHARDPMAAKKKRAKNIHISVETKAWIVEQLKKGELQQRDIASQAGVHESTVSTMWQAIDPNYVPADAKKHDKAIEYLRAGKARAWICEKVGISNQTLQIWARRAGIGASRSSNTDVALGIKATGYDDDDIEGTDNATQLSRPQPPPSRQQSLALPPSGPVSAPRSAAPRSYAAMPAPMPRPPAPHYMSPPPAPPMGGGIDLAADALHEALEERHTLRKMLDIVSREKQALERENQELRARLANA